MLKKYYVDINIDSALGIMNNTVSLDAFTNMFSTDKGFLITDFEQFNDKSKFLDYLVPIMVFQFKEFPKETQEIISKIISFSLIEAVMDASNLLLETTCIKTYYLKVLLTMEQESK